MKIEVTVKLTTDDGKCTEAVSNSMQLATGLVGSDASLEKSEFLTQVENMIAFVRDTQVPLLYDTVEEDRKREAEREEIEKAKKAKKKQDTEEEQ